MLKHKESGKRRKLYHFSDMIQSFNYYEDRYINYKGFEGCLFTLSNPDNDKLRQIENQYDNIEIIITCCEYAPEVKKTCIFMGR